MSHLFSKRLITIASTLISILLALNIFFTYRNSKEIEKNRLLQEQTEEIKEVLSKIAIDVIHNLDLGIRSYALFNEERYLYPFHKAIRERESILNTMELLLSQQNYPLAEFYHLRDSINAYTNLNRKLKILIDDRHSDEFMYLANQDKGYLLWLQYEQFAAHVNTFENVIHARATKQYESALRNIYLIQFSLFFICIPTLLFTTLYTKKTFALDAKLKAAEIDRAKLLLSQKVQLEKEVFERTKEVRQKNLELRQKHRKIAAQNEELRQQQEEISSQRDLLAIQNKKLYKAQQIILKQNEGLEIEVDKKTKELVAYNQQLEQFAFATAHNLRSPIARILGLGEVLDYVSGNKEEEKLVVKNIITSTIDLDTVIKDLNKILEIKFNINSQLSEINFKEEVKLIKANLENEIGDSQCEILEYFREVPSVISVKAYTDSIIFNLISNALKYRSHDRALCITLRTSCFEDFICLEVQDNGVGIDLEKYGKDVFSLYKRFNTHTEGKGLGLYLVKMQAIALGGWVEVTSTPNQGSTFKVYFKKH